jgi:hypothetical protein
MLLKSLQAQNDIMRFMQVPISRRHAYLPLRNLSKARMFGACDTRVPAGRHKNVFGMVPQVVFGVPDLPRQLCNR